MVPNLRCGLRNQSSRTPSSATRFSTPFTPMSEVFTAPARISTPTIDDEDVEAELEHVRPGEIHHQAADHVVVDTGCGRASGMIITANTEITPVQITA